MRARLFVMASALSLYGAGPASPASVNFFFDRDSFLVTQFELGRFASEPGDEVFVPVAYNCCGLPEEEGGYYQWQVTSDLMFAIVAPGRISPESIYVIDREPQWVDSPFGGQGLASRGFGMSVLPFAPPTRLYGTHPIKGIGFDFFGPAVGDTVYIEPYGWPADLNHLSFVYTGPTFIGMYAIGAGIDNLRIYALPPGGSQMSPLPYVTVAIDNLVYTTPTPEPCSISLIPAGIFGVWMLARRRRRFLRILCG
ncbi:MAG TPA: hypothetical protein VG672_07475 [Bryobacteraceae bacterium]|nr:hypothetical protein [Bryobacteraceae bacterium]